MFKKIFLFIWEITKIAVIALLIVLPVRYFLFQPFIVKGDSMYPNFFSSDYLIIDEISYRFSSPQRGDVVVFKYPLSPSQRFIKRIVGLPNETVEIKDNKVLIHDPEGESQFLDESKYLSGYQDFGVDQLTKLGANEYYVLGDNRTFSLDSRKWGALPKDHIIGKVFLRLFPLGALAKIETPLYINE